MLLENKNIYILKIIDIKKFMRKILLILFLIVPFIFLISSVYAYVIVDSQDWHDTYLASLYAAVNGEDFNFIINEAQGKNVIQGIPPGSDVLLITGEKQYFPAIVAQLKAKNCNVEEIKLGDYTDLMKELAKRLDVENIVVISPTFGYDAISVAPYAIKTHGFVYFVDENNIDRVKDELSNKKLILYGDLHRDVISSLTGERINEGSRFHNNLKILEKYYEEFSAPQLIVTSGEFMEASLFSGQPIMLLGKQKVLPEQIEFVKQHEIRVILLIGYELLDVANVLKEKTGVRGIMKFGKGTAQAGGEFMRKVEPLDLYFMPFYTPEISIEKASYDIASKKLYVKFFNPGVILVYFTSVVSVAGRVYEHGIEKINPDSSVVVEYPSELTEKETKDINVTVIYGEAEKALEYEKTATLQAEVSEISDKCNLTIDGGAYNEKSLILKVFVSTNTECYAKPSVSLTSLGKRKYLVEDVQLIKGKGTFTFDVRMDRLDLKEGVEVEIDYGENKEFLFKKAKKKIYPEIEKESSSMIYLIIIASIIIASILVLVKRKRE